MLCDRAQDVPYVLSGGDRCRWAALLGLQISFWDLLLCYIAQPMLIVRHSTARLKIGDTPVGHPRSKRVSLKRRTFEDRAHRLGLTTQTAQAAAMDVHHTMHHRALTGERQALSGWYVLGVLRLVGDDNVRKHIDALFDISTSP